MEKIAITGGVASGKSYAGRFLLAKGYDVIDLDDINKEILPQNKESLIKIFGVKALQDNQINTSYIKEIVFNNKTKLTELENLLHPQIIDLMQQKIARAKSDKVFIIVPLLYEKKLFSYFDKAIIISTTEQNQTNRIIKRDNIDKELASKILQNQVDDKTRLKTQNFLPSIIIENNYTIDEFITKLEQIKL